MLSAHLDEEELPLYANPLVATLNQEAEVRDTPFCPVKVTISNATCWAMADTGAMCSVISSGLVAHLRLMESEDIEVYQSKFSITGFDDSSHFALPIIGIWLRFGNRGDNLRWERMQFAVIDSSSYKWIIGRDFLVPR